VKKKDNQALAAYLGLVIPGLAVYLVIVAYPILYSLWLSLTDFNPNRGGSWSFVGLLQYRTMLRDPAFWHALKNNLVVVAVSVFGQIPIGFALAYILFRKLVRAGIFYQSMVFFPNFLSTIVIGTLWKRLFQADGPVARLLQLLSGDPSAQFDLMLRAETVMYPIGFALIWMYTGLYMSFSWPTCRSWTNLIEAAKIDGPARPDLLPPHRSAAVRHSLVSRPWPSPGRCAAST
jgi:raffinose/stachyose/melibiose transport system permease protein